jgi:hypothetical protein
MESQSFPTDGGQNLVGKRTASEELHPDTAAKRIKLPQDGSTEPEVQPPVIVVPFPEKVC